WVLADVSANHDAPLSSVAGGGSVETGDHSAAAMMAEALRKSSASSSFSSRLRQSSSTSLTGYGAALPGSTTASPHHARAGSGVVDISGTSDGDESGSSLEGDGNGKGPPTPVFEKSALQPWHPLGAPTAGSTSVPGTPSPRRRGGDDLELSDDGDTFSDDDDDDDDDDEDGEEDFHQARQGSVPATAAKAVAQSSSEGAAATAEEAEKRRKRAVALKEIISVGGHSPVRRLASKGTDGTNFKSHFQGGWSDTGLSGGPEASSSAPAGAGAVRAKTFGLKREIRGTKLENVFKEMKEETDGGEGGSGKSPAPTPHASAPHAENPPAVSLRLRAPLVLHNLLCAPMLYRVVNRQGLLSAEGVLPVGASVALHRVDLCQKQYASFLLVNYPWSDFIKVHSPTSAHPLREKVRTVEVRGVKVSVPGEESSSAASSSSSSSSSKKGRELPGLHLHVALQARRYRHHLSVFCRLWLVNRTEMVLQHRDSSLAGGIDSTFMGDRMPQITQPGWQETTGTEGGAGGVVVDYRLHRSASVGTGALTPTKGGDGARGGGMTPPRSLARAATDAALRRGNGKNTAPSSPTPSYSSLASPTRPSQLGKGPPAGGVGFSGRGTVVGGAGGGGGGGGKASPPSKRSPSPGGVGFHGGRGVRIALTVALPCSHLDEVDVEVPASETAEGLLLAVAAEARLGPIDPAEYFLCPLQAPSEDDALALSEIMTWEMDKRSLVDGQLRALKQSFGVSSGVSRASAGYARWDRLGFVFDDYRPVHPSTLVSNLGTPWLRMCHRAELAAAAQSSQWLGAALPPGTGLDALAGSRPSASSRPAGGRPSSRASSAAAGTAGGKTPSATAGFFAAIQSVSSSGGSTAAGSAGAARAAATGPKGCSARLSETVKGVATLAEWGPAVMFGPVESLDKMKLCSRVQDSEWCSSVDVAGLKTAAGGTACISVEQEKPSSHREASPRTRYDIGIQVGPGEGDFRRTMVLTLLPRYVLINALPRTLEFTQASCGGRWRGVLPPGARRAFHWPFAKDRRALNVRFLSESDNDDEWIWSGDLKLDTVGEVAVKLRAATGGGGPGKEYITRVKLALVGASVTAVFERQDLRWPPYRVDNLTSLGIRYRQALSSSDASRVPAAAEGGAGSSEGRRKGELPWDGLGPQAAAPFTWDQPVGESRVLTVGFEQAGKWEEREYRLDELEKHKRVSLTRTLPSLENPRLRGEMLQRQTGTLTDVWRRRWAVLKGPVLFLFKDKGCVHLRGAIYLGATRSTGDQGGGGARGGAAGPQRAQIGQKTGGRDKGDILDKMGNMMDDAVGLLVGPEFVSSGGGEAGVVGGMGMAGISATAVTVAAAAAAAAAKVTATFPGSEGASASAAAAGGGDHVRSGATAAASSSMRADEALALGGMMWKHMTRMREGPQATWGLGGGVRRASLSQSLHWTEDGGAAGSVPGHGLPRVPSGLGTTGGRPSAGDPQQPGGGGVSGGRDGTRTTAGRRFSGTTAAFHQGMTLAEWSMTLTEMGGSGHSSETAAEVSYSEAEWMCRQLVELGLLVPLPSTLQSRQHAGTAASAAGAPGTPRRGRTSGGTSRYSGTQDGKMLSAAAAAAAAAAAGAGVLPEDSPFPAPSSPKSGLRPTSESEEGGERGNGVEAGRSGHERGGLGRTGSGLRRSGSQQMQNMLSTDPAAAAAAAAGRSYLLRDPGRDVDLDPDGTGMVRVLSAAGAKHDLRCDSAPAALRWIEAMRDAVDADCVEALKKSGRATPAGTGTAAAAAAEAAERASSAGAGSGGDVSAPRLEGGEAIMSRLRAKVYVNVRVRADGPTKVLELVEEAGEEVEDDDGAVAAALGKKGRESSGGGPESEGAGALAAAAAADASSVTSVYMLQMAGIGVSLVDDRPLELLYFLACGIKADITATAR
ncbi:unnamed protein product, partial [Ectocarpus fasciculatus]